MKRILLLGILIVFMIIFSGLVISMDDPAPQSPSPSTNPLTPSGPQPPESDNDNNSSDGNGDEKEIDNKPPAASQPTPESSAATTTTTTTTADPTPSPPSSNSTPEKTDKDIPPAAAEETPTPPPSAADQVLPPAYAEKDPDDSAKDNSKGTAPDDQDDTASPKEITIAEEMKSKFDSVRASYDVMTEAGGRPYDFVTKYKKDYKKYGCADAPSCLTRLSEEVTSVLVMIDELMEYYRYDRKMDQLTKYKEFFSTVSTEIVDVSNVT